MFSFKGFIEEGKHDPAIFKCIFMAGGPGSGKSHISSALGLRALGFAEINSDKSFELGLKKSLLSLDMPDSEEFPRNIVRNIAKKTTKSKKGHAVEGRLGMVIDGTGKDLSKIKKQAAQLEELGYETAMVLVNTSLDTSLQRNDERERSVNPKLVTKSWKGVQSNIGGFKKLFGNRFWVIDNDDFETSAAQSSKLYTKIMTWAKDVPNNDKVKQWMVK